jgi:hypothetical protein
MNTTYPYPGTNEIAKTGYPAVYGPSADNTSAFDAYLIAKEAAMKWDQGAMLYKIPATFVMERNLGYPITGEGWFFMFRNPTSPLEYYVYVWNHKVSGTTEAQPITINGGHENDLIPIGDPVGLIDSNVVMGIFYEEFPNNSHDLKVNLELQRTKELGSPLWIVYNFSTLPEKVLMVINAENGEILSLPRE